MQKLLITAGLFLIIIGLTWPWLSQLPLGKLPGDISIEGDGYRFYLPLTTMLLISAVVSIIVWLFR